MRYTNKHLKASYKFYIVALYISLLGVALSIVLLAFGFIGTQKLLGNIQPLETVLREQSNPANKTAYIEIIKVPEKISEDKYEEYYLVTTQKNTYISGMQKEQFETLKKEVEEQGKARLEGMTKVIIDKEVIAEVQNYLNEKNIHIRVTELTYGKILKEGYIVNLVLGGLFGIVSAIFVLLQIYELNKYKNPQAKKIDEECNRKAALWLKEYQIYLTDNYIVSTYNGINAIDIKEVAVVKLYDSKQNNRNVRILEGKLKDNREVSIYEKSVMEDYIYEEDRAYLQEIFDRKNIKFLCEVEIYKDDEEE